jgi:hypothetical protein
LTTTKARILTGFVNKTNFSNNLLAVNPLLGNDHEICKHTAAVINNGFAGQRHQSKAHYNDAIKL